jgi:ribonuclease P protein component
MLPAINRLQKNREFEKVFKHSRPIHTENFTFRIAARRNIDFATRFGYVISNKIDKRATRRNALKRQLRQVTWDLISTLKSGYDVVVMVKKDFPFPYKQEEIKEQFLVGLKKSEIF